MKFEIQYKGSSIEIDSSEKLKIVVNGKEHWIEAAALVAAPTMVTAIDKMKAEIKDLTDQLPAAIEEAQVDANIMAGLIRFVFANCSFRKMATVKWTTSEHPIWM